MDKKHAYKIIHEYINRLMSSEIKIDSVYLFGSYAKGSIHKDSDIDLAIILDKIKNTFETEVKLMTLRKNDETIIEPHIFEKEDFVKKNPFVNEILKTGVKIDL